MSKWKTPKGTELEILSLRGKDYLPVQWRLVWFREERPTWTIDTNAIEITATSAFFKTVIKDEQGRLIASAHKFEDKQGFADFREKAETGSVGRALAMIGYGTQFCADDLDEGSRIADAPVSRSGLPQIKPEQPSPNDGFQRPEGTYRIPSHIGSPALAGRHPEDADPVLLREKIEELEAKYKGKIMPLGAVKFITECEPFVAAYENQAVTV